MTNDESIHQQRLAEIRSSSRPRLLVPDEMDGMERGSHPWIQLCSIAGYQYECEYSVRALVLRTFGWIRARAHTRRMERLSLTGWGSVEVSKGRGIEFGAWMEIVWGEKCRCGGRFGARTEHLDAEYEYEYEYSTRHSTECSGTPHGTHLLVRSAP